MELLLDTLKAVQDSNISSILIVAGIVFILLALAGGFSGKINIPKQRQKWAGAIGAVLFLSGLGLYIVPSLEQTSENDEPVKTEPLDNEEKGEEQAKLSRAQISELASTALNALKMGRIAEADATLQKAEGLINDALLENPDDTWLHIHKGYLHKNLAVQYQRLSMGDNANEQISEAEKSFRIVLAADANNASALNGMGNVYYMRKEYDKAEEYIRSALAISPNYRAAQHDLQVVQRAKQR